VWCSSLAGPSPGSPHAVPDTVLARGRSVITRPIHTAGLNGQSQSCYTALAAAVKKAEAIDANLVLSVVEPISGRVGRLPLALHDRADRTVRTARPRNRRLPEFDNRSDPVAVRLRCRCTANRVWIRG
jgi:hypothetical protein